MNEDGSGLETLNHVGRHELMAFAGAAKPQFFNFYKDGANDLSGLFLHIKEDPKSLGTYLGTTCQEFYTHGAGQIVSVNGGVDVNADDMGVTYLTDPMTRMATLDGQQPPPNHPGHFRNPVPLSSGALVAVRTTSPFKNKQTGPGQFDVLYDFHLSRLEKQGQYWVPVEKLNPNGIVKSVSYWDNWVYQQVSYNGPMWELDPVEVRPRAKKKHKDPLPDIETQIVNEELGGTSGMNRLRNYLKAHRLAMLVSRDVTRRADKQQEFNLKIAGSSTQTAVQGSTPEEIAFIQSSRAT